MQTATKACAVMLAAALAIAAWDHLRRPAAPAPALPQEAHAATAAATQATRNAPAATVAPALATREVPVWTVAPEVIGDDASVAGPSLFDLRIEALGGAAALPYPFEKLLERLEGDARCPDLPDGRCLVRVLIPIGRSLQRLVAAPEFFRRPRIVAAMAGEPAAGAKADGPLQRDRLYLGHVSGSDLIEVISYNEAAARFEFQLVRDYRPGATPSVTYASRAVCVSCHQNHAPIFSRPLWLETNANPAVSARLAAFGERFEGVPARRGVDLPAAIDAAVARANRLALWQILWREGCGDDERGARCRAALLEAALHYRAAGRHDYPAGLREAIRPAFAAAWQARWPAGLALPDPNIPNRDPLPEGPIATAGPTLAHIPAAFDPLAPRPAAEVWRAPDDERLNETIAGIADLLGAHDLARLDLTLRGRYSTPANLARLRGALDRIVAQPDAGPFAYGSFRRDRVMAALLAQLGGPPERTPRPPPAAATARYADHQPMPGAGLFQRYCTPCHQTPERAPANFLHGTDATVREGLARCAARIRYRLAMWQLPADTRPKTPMPPPQALSSLGADAEKWAASAELKTLQTYAAELAGGGPVPRPDNYETLPPCLPG